MPSPHNIEYEHLIAAVTDYAIFMLDPAGHIMSWNAGARAIKGYAADEIIGRHISVFYPSDAIERGWPQEELRLARAAGRFEDEGWRVRKDGSRFWANVVITALHSENGELTGFSKITRDLSERRRRETALRDSEERFRLLIEGVRDYGIFMLDPEGRVASWNPGAQTITGYSADEIIGRHFSAFYLAEDLAKDWPAHELSVASTEGRYEEEGWRLRKDGSRFLANVVITALRNTDGSLRGFAKVTRDLTLRSRVQALEESEQQMNQFLAMLSHELRNPLAPIRNAVATLQASPDSNAAATARDLIARQVSHLSRLIDDLIDTSRISRGIISVVLKPIDLADIARRSLEAVADAAAAKRHRLTADLGDAPLRVSGDATRIEQVLVNLLNNAIKYTPDGGAIMLSLRRAGSQAEVRVRDTGRGMDRRTLEHMFDLFYQGNPSLDRSEGGLGVGLTLVKKMVEAHSGEVVALSEGNGKGSELVVRLPLLSGADAARVEETTPEPAGAAGRRVLIVDDNQDAADSLALLLQTLGHDVQVAYDGPSGIVAARRGKPQFVLLDIGLPGRNGYEVVKELRSFPELARTAIVAVTGYGQPADRARSLAAGFDHHLVKPVDLAELQKVLAA